MKRLLFLFLLLTFAVPLHSALAALTNREILEHRIVCEDFGLEETKRNQCYYDLAFLTKDATICGQISWVAKRSSCRQQILYSGSQIHWKSYISQAPFVILVFAFFFCFLLKPPRAGYFKGMLIGAFIGLALLYLGYLRQDYLSFVMPISQIIGSPVDGFVRHAPAHLSLYLTYTQRFMLAHVILYGMVIGLFLRGEKKDFQYIYLIIFFSLLLSYWEHPSVYFVHEYFQEVIQ